MNHPFVIIGLALVVVTLEAAIVFLAAALEPLAIYVSQFVTPRGAA